MINGKVVGIRDSKKLLEDIPNKVRDTLGIIVDVNLHIEYGKEYLEIYTAPSAYPISYKGEYHYRTGSTKQLLQGQALNQFIMQKTGVTWDSVPISDVSVSDLRNDSFDIFREQSLQSQRMSEKDLKISNEQLLDSLNLLEKEHLKRSAILLFHHKPEKWIPGTIYKDKMYIANDGILPDGWTVENLMKPHRSRSFNPLIANTFFRAGFIETWGRGIKKIMESCEQAGTPYPSYEISSEDIVVTFYPAKSKKTTKKTDVKFQNIKLTVFEKSILDLIAIDAKITQNEIADVMNCDRNRIKYYIDKLKEKGVLKRVGSKRVGEWHIDNYLVNEEK